MALRGTDAGPERAGDARMLDLWMKTQAPDYRLRKRRGEGRREIRLGKTAFTKCINIVYSVTVAHWRIMFHLHSITHNVHLL